MWPVKLNLVSVLFFITRYMPVVDMTVTLYSAFGFFPLDSGY